LQQKNKHQTRLLITLFADILQGELKKTTFQNDICWSICIHYFGSPH